MTKPSHFAAPQNPEKVAKSRGDDLRVHFKNTRETAMAIKGMFTLRAKQYLINVLRHRDCIPFRRFNYGIGRTPQAKNHGTSQGRWPKKSVEHVLSLLENAIANATVKGLDVDQLKVSAISVQRAQKQRRRTYRAHGRINPFMCSPSSIQIQLSEVEKKVSKPKEQKIVKKD
ncbi:S60 ribosomal protein L17 [Cavenderia fasciculata]|uniref:S60 ribosomal protein L17 n=1 Tax=Cavenderia fasciculata TaxID=261658 RepID=F4Q0P8_CACFS|nr:S60 ribosomal protein L17 [Cavenderia fasciculata]EGG18399.1 S60 ribosomal protein L17 [Cavenderia fasciculata]|eukprot:XP_004366303.1 S60 ribosomal protein L17 [Cavenderia fasciculata]